jgi:hypothetical protein
MAVESEYFSQVCSWYVSIYSAPDLQGKLMDLYVLTRKIALFGNPWDKYILKSDACRII